MINYAVHPGKTIKYILMSMGKTQKWLSEEMNMSKVIISELINGKRNVTTAIAVAFENATGFSAEKLLKMQLDYDLFIERTKNVKKMKVSVLDDSKTNEFDSKVFLNKKSSLSLAS